MRREAPAIAVLLVCATALLCAQNTTADTSSPHPDAREIMQKAVAKDIFNWTAAKDYTFLERMQQDSLDGRGSVKSSKSETHEIMVLYGEPFERTIAKDDKPLSEKEQKKQDEEFEKETHKRESESPEERRKRVQKYEKDREDERAFVREILDAYDFTLAGHEILNGRATWVIDGSPHSGFEGKRRESKMLPRIKPRFWIDQQDYSWAKLRAEFTDTVSFGWIVARVHKGSEFEMQQVLINGEVWMPQRADIKLDARVALLKGVNEDIHLTYKDYRKFRTDTKISVAESAPVQ